VAKNVETVWRRELNAFGYVTVLQLVGKVTEFTVDTLRDNGLVCEKPKSIGSRGEFALGSIDGYFDH
jgi:hypothetical protein